MVPEGYITPVGAPATRRWLVCWLLIPSFPSRILPPHPAVFSFAAVADTGEQLFHCDRGPEPTAAIRQVIYEGCHDLFEGMVFQVSS